MLQVEIAADAEMRFSSNATRYMFFFAAFSELVYNALGLAGEKRTAQLMDAVARHDAKTALELFSALYASGKDIAAMLDELTALSRDLLILKTAPKSGLTMLSGVTTDQEALSLMDKFTAAELLRTTTVLQETASGFVKSANRRVDAELCILRLCDPNLDLDVRAISARLSKVEDRIASGQFVQAAAQIPIPEDDDRPPFYDDADAPPFFDEDAPPVPPMVKAEEAPSGFWPDFVSKVQNELPGRAKGIITVNGAVSHQLEHDVLTLIAPGPFEQKQLDMPAVLEPCSRAASALLGRPIRIRVQLRSKQTAPGGDQAFNGLMNFGKQHSDIIKFTK